MYVFVETGKKKSITLPRSKSLLDKKRKRSFYRLSLLVCIPFGLKHQQLLPLCFVKFECF